jgi:hypothetical protein
MNRDWISSTSSPSRAQRPGLRRQRREPGKAHHPRLPANAVRFADERVAVRPSLREARQGQRQRAGASARDSATGSTGCGRWCGTPARCRCSTTGATPCWNCCRHGEMLTRLPFALGPLEGHRLAIDVPALTQALGELIRSGTCSRLRSIELARTHRRKRWRLSHPTEARLARARLPSPPSPGDFHGTHVPAARPQFRSRTGTSPPTNPRSKERASTHWPSDRPMCILDPCAGEGVAIAEAAHALGREQAKAFAVEYDAERAATHAAWSIAASTGPDGHADLRSPSGCCGSTRRMAT